MKFFVLQIFLPALAFAQDSSSFNDDDGPTAGDILGVIFVAGIFGIPGCLYYTCRKCMRMIDGTDDTDSNDTLSWVSIRLSSYTV